MTTNQQKHKSSYFAPEYKPAPPTFIEKLAPWLTNVAHLAFLIFILGLAALFVFDTVAEQLNFLNDIASK